MLTQLKKEISTHPTYYILLITILLVSFFLRIFRTEDLMGFYYDQGRDALVIWKLWYEGKLFLVGPVTGLAGIFLGPLYYYLIAPFYLMGGGNPVYPAVFLALTTVLALIPLYILGKEMHSRTAGITAAAIGGLSHSLILSSRWLSNPTPMFLMSVLILWVMWRICNKQHNYLWVLLALLIGISLQFESASAVFYVPMVLVFAIWQKKSLPSLKTSLLCGLVLLVTLIPQIAFNFRHDNLIINNFKRVLFDEQSFRLSFWEVFELRLSYIWRVFWSKLYPEERVIALFFTIISFYSLLTKYEKISKGIKLLLIFIGIPVIGYFTFQGNSGNVYDYYMTGYYLPMMLLFSLGLANLAETLTGKIIFTMFFISFIYIGNLKYTKDYLSQPMLGEHQIKLGTELAATNWVLDNAKQKNDQFNIKIYVPPVIPYAYDYLLLWKGQEKCGDDLCGYNKLETQNLIYTIYENDTIHPDSLAVWKAENELESTLIDKQIFGGVTAEKRTRNE